MKHFFFLFHAHPLTSILFSLTLSLSYSHFLPLPLSVCLQSSMVTLFRSVATIRSLLKPIDTLLFGSPAAPNGNSQAGTGNVVGVSTNSPVPQLAAPSLNQSAQAQLEPQVIQKQIELLKSRIAALENVFAQVCDAIPSPLYSLLYLLCVSLLSSFSSLTLSSFSSFLYPTPLHIIRH